MKLKGTKPTNNIVIGFQVSQLSRINANHLFILMAISLLSCVSWRPFTACYFLPLSICVHCLSSVAFSFLWFSTMSARRNASGCQFDLSELPGCILTSYNCWHALVGMVIVWSTYLEAVLLPKASISQRKIFKEKCCFMCPEPEGVNCKWAIEVKP